MEKEEKRVGMMALPILQVKKLYGTISSLTKSNKSLIAKNKKLTKANKALWDRAERVEVLDGLIKRQSDALVFALSENSDLNEQITARDDALMDQSRTIVMMEDEISSLNKQLDYDEDLLARYEALQAERDSLATQCAEMRDVAFKVRCGASTTRGV